MAEKLTQPLPYKKLRKRREAPLLEPFVFSGKSGHFPFLEKEWIQEYAQNSNDYDDNSARTFFFKLSEFKSHQKKNEFLHSLELEERNIVIHKLFKQVEEAILDENLPIQ